MMLELLSKLYIPGFLLFGLLGYFCGFLFRDIGILKILAIILLLPELIVFITTINDMVYVTLPYLVGTVFGFLGPEKIKRNLILAGDALKDLKERF